MKQATPETMAALGGEAAAYLETARTVATAEFGEATVNNVPLLVTQVAWLMATLESNRMSETN